MNFHPIENSSETAKIVVPLLINLYRPYPASVLDLGCNVGWWLYWFKRNGIKLVRGVDGDNMIPELKITPWEFISHDLTKPFRLVNQKFDLVLCLEVAEHLDEKYADILVDNAVRHSDVIIWSAAEPGQGGYNHVNEQPAEYWIEKFKERGYDARLLKDSLPKLPHDYYRKNAIEFIKNE